MKIQLISESKCGRHAEIVIKENGTSKTKHVRLSGGLYADNDGKMYDLNKGKVA